MHHLSHHQTPGKVGPCCDIVCSFSIMAGPLLASWVRFLYKQVLMIVCGCLSGKLNRNCYCSICRSSLNIVALEGTGPGSEVDISTAGGTQNFGARQAVCQWDPWETMVIWFQVLGLYHHALQLSSHMAKTVSPTQHWKPNITEYSSPPESVCGSSSAWLSKEKDWG